MDSPGRPKRVLMLTNSEFGQSNVFYAVSYALLNLDKDVELHFGSFEPAREPVARISKQATDAFPHARPIIFHHVPGLNMEAAYRRPELNPKTKADEAPKSLADGWRKGQLVLRITNPWFGPEFADIFQSIIDIIEEVKADVIAVDPLFGPALTAIKHLGVKCIVLSPNSIKDFVVALQPNMEAVWKYPCVGTGFTFPVPFFLIPFNIFVVFFVIIIAYFDSHSQEIARYMKEHKGCEKLITPGDYLFNHQQLGYKILVPVFREMDYPLKVVPRHIIPVGPMICPAKSVKEADPELARWLARGPTLIINLGTHFIMPEEMAVGMAEALRSVLDHAASSLEVEPRMTKLQVLWKLVRKKTEDGEPAYEVDVPKSRVHDLLGRYMDTDTLRIVKWIGPEPSAVLENDNVLVSVHHGGANSFLEAANSGKRQVVLPPWLDTFDFANRAEILGIGLCANKTTRPNFSADEFEKVLFRVLFSEEGTSIQEKADELADLCRANGAGRNVAARMILSEIKKWPRKRLLDDGI